MLFQTHTEGHDALPFFRGYFYIEMTKKPIRIGLIIPSSNTTVEPEFARMSSSLPWLTVHTSRIDLVEVTPEALIQMVKGIERSASLLAHASVNAICLACTSASFLKGKDHLLSLKDAMERATGLPCITTSESVVIALEALEARRIGLVTPYIPQLNTLEIEFLQESIPKLEIVCVKSFHLQSNLEIGRLSLERIHYFSRDLIEEYHPDTLFLSCTNMPSIDLIQPLENESGISVITSNSASLFGLLWLLNQKIRIEGFGKLLGIMKTN